MDREQAARRTRAALALAGYRNVEDLAKRLNGSGVGLKRLREIYQRRGNEPRTVELREIAEACGLPYEFFTVDFATLSGGAASAALERRLAALEDIIRDDVVPILGREVRIPEQVDESGHEHGRSSPPAPSRRRGGGR